MAKHNPHNPYKQAATNMLKQVGNQGINSGVAALREAVKPGHKEGEPDTSKSAPPGPKGETSKQPYEVGEQYRDHSKPPGSASPEEAARKVLAQSNEPDTDGDMPEDNDADDQGHGDESQHPDPAADVLRHFGRKTSKRSIELGSKRPTDHRYKQRK